MPWEVGLDLSDGDRSVLAVAALALGAAELAARAALDGDGSQLGVIILSGHVGTSCEAPGA